MKNPVLHFVIAAILLYFPTVNLAQAPLLGTAANFVLFSSNGAVTNTQFSYFTGNIGTNNGSSTGFGNVNGQMHDNDGTTAAAAADLLLAYNQLNATIPTANHAPLLGNGDTLTAGVYAISGVTTLNVTLVLDGKGDSASVFIFKINAAFSTNTNSKIQLINGAQACNVFWKVEGQVSMAAGTVMRGNVIANNAAINMTVGDTLEGRALSTTGAITTNGVLAYTPVGCGSPLLTGPAAPALASTACYALFSGSGGVTNGGITYVTGDIGTNVGLTSGYDSIRVTGTIHSIPDSSTKKCAADLLNVYTYLNTLPADIELLYPAQFGNNLVLTPHTYLLNAATTFTDTLFLNAQGNANAVFVIKINGALSTSTYATVTLTNGAQAANIYWKVDGAVNINNYSNFKGTVICNNGAISLTTGVILTGRALTTSGALSTAAITAAITPGCNTILANDWLYFRGKPVQENVLLEWGTTNEMNNGFFTIEKSSDSRNFEKLATINASKERGPLKYVYSFTDVMPYSLSYYRIYQTDNDGQKKYFNTIQVKVIVGQVFKARHYVLASNVYVQTSGAAPGAGSIEVYSIDGKKVSTQAIMLTKEVNLYKLDKPLNNGMYLLFIKSRQGRLYTGKVMVE